MKKWLQSKLLNPLLELLKQGVSVEKISASLAAGVVVCCFPILGATSLVCFIVAVIFKLNHVAIQIANYVTYPLQFVFLIPFLHLGNKIFGYSSMDFSISDMTVEFQIDALMFFEKYAGVALRAIVAWSLVAPIAFVILYYTIQPLVLRIWSFKKVT